MVGSRGRGRASASKSKSKALAFVPADPKPLDMEGSADCPLVEEEKSNEMPIMDENPMNEKERDDTDIGLEGGSDGLEEQPLPVDERNGEENDTLNNVNDDCNDDSIHGETDVDLEESNDEGNADNEVDAEYTLEFVNDQSSEEVIDNGCAPNNVGVEGDEEMTNGEALEEHEAPLNDFPGHEDIHFGEEKEISDIDAEGKEAVTEGATAVEHEKIDDTTNVLNTEGNANTIEAEELLGPIADEKNVESAIADACIADNVKAAPENATKPKRKILKKKLVKKKVPPAVNKDEPQSLVGNDVSNEAKQVENEHGKDEDKGGKVVKITKKLKKMKGKGKVMSENNAGVSAASDAQNSEPANNEPSNEVYEETDKQEAKDEEAAKSAGQVRRLKKKKKAKKVSKNGTSNVAAEDMNKPGPSRKGKSQKMDSMGMIFMCSAETKKDCYRYKVLGLPAGKKDSVLKIYKGMRLFLFDFKLRLMYGIYKAASPGGYNIEPKAFKSQFPSQVRFTVIEECVPLAEEKFKKVIKDNYYSKNKFNCELTNEQVKNLCKLFSETTKKADSKKVGRRSQIAAISSPPSRDRKRKRRVEDTTRRAGHISSSKRGRRHRQAEEDIRPTNHVVTYYNPHPVYDRETYVQPTVPRVVYQQPLPVQSPPLSSIYSSYGRIPRVDDYRRDPPLERRELGLQSLVDLRRPVEPERRDPYVTYREPARTYQEPLAYERQAPYETATRRSHYEVEPRRENYDYGVDVRRDDYYRPAEYRAPLPPYRRY